MSQATTKSTLDQVWLQFQLESDATFGRGDGIPGLVDRDVALDEYGCPYLHGRTLKGLLSEVCADVLFALHAHATYPLWKTVADRLFGEPGSGQHGQGILYVGHAQLPTALYAAIRKEIIRHRTVGQGDETGWTPQAVTAALTTVRRQTALEVGGAPDPATLRTQRVILRLTQFTAPLTFRNALKPEDQALLAVCVKGLRRAGIARNRGRGRLTAWLTDEQGKHVTDTWYEQFKVKVGGE